MAARPALSSAPSRVWPAAVMMSKPVNFSSSEKYGRNSYDSAIEFGDIKVYRNAYKVTAAGEDVNLSNTEFKLLLYFIDNAYTALTRKQILYNVWESEVYDEGTVTTYVNRLRSKIDKDEKHIKSVRGVGYIFEK